MNRLFSGSLRLKLCLVACLTLNALSFAGNIIFDLNGVCIETSKKHGFWQIKKELFKVPSRIIGAQNFMLSFLTSLMNYEPNIIIPCDDKGKPMPRIMHAYMIGQMSSHEIRTLIKETLSADTQRGPAEKQLLQVMSDIVFVPENFVATQILNPQAHDLVKACKNRGHNVYVLSNWDTESFELMREKYPDFFNEFDGIVISGAVGLAKPDPAIYEYIMAYYDLDPSSCILLDDQLINVEAARQCGMSGIQVKQSSFLFTSSIDLKNARKRIRAWEKSIGFEPVQIA